MSTAARRRARLLDDIRQRPREVRTGEVMRLYRANGWGPSRATARHDLQYFARRGVLIEHGPEDDRHYTLNLAKAGTR
ncbi:MAG: hypothetical protein HOY79_01800 [Streptomyces sp.]|nr:hypothetical protein [Streptomyces sp.]